MSSKKNSKMEDVLTKCDELIEKLESLNKSIVQTSSSRKPVNTLSPGWSIDQSTGTLHHSTLGMITTSKSPSGQYEIAHGSRKVGTAANPEDAGKRIRDYVNSLRPGNVNVLKDDDESVNKSSEENTALTKLVNLMQNKSMFKQLTSKEMLEAGSKMGIGTSEEVAKSEGDKWSNTFSSWAQEASKPISSRFASKEEEEAYWASIRISDRDDGKSGY